MMEDAERAATRNAQLTDEYLACIESCAGDLEGRREAHRLMQQSSARYHGEIVASAFVPRLFDDASWDELRAVTETTHGILIKVMQRYLEDPAYRHLFSFDPRLEELICLPRGHTSLLPFARIDVFYDEETGTCRFCEFNGDGSSGMNEDREVFRSIAGSASYRAFAQRHALEPCELFFSWVDAFLAIYRSFPGAVERPHIAICDYLDVGVIDEFEQYAACFAGRGLRCSIVDVRDLTFDGTALRDGQGAVVHAIWRRCVTNDVLAHWDETQPLIEAVRAGAVALIGSFAGHLVHDKQLFRVLRHPDTLALLTEEERGLIAQAVPYTEFLASESVDLDAVKRSKDAWVIKPTDSYGAHNVFVGARCTQKEWEAAVERCAGTADEGKGPRRGCVYLLQEFVAPSRRATLEPDTHIDDLSDDQIDRAPIEYNELLGLYVYDGSFTGVFTRQGPHPIVCGAHDGVTAATVRVRSQCERPFRAANIPLHPPRKKRRTRHADPPFSEQPRSKGRGL